MVLSHNYILNVSDINQFELNMPKKYIYEDVNFVNISTLRS